MLRKSIYGKRSITLSHNIVVEMLLVSYLQSVKNQINAPLFPVLSPHERGESIQMCQCQGDSVLLVQRKPRFSEENDGIFDDFANGSVRVIATRNSQIQLA